MKNEDEIRDRLIRLFQEQREYDCYERGLKIEELEWVLGIIKGKDIKK